MRLCCWHFRCVTSGKSTALSGPVSSRANLRQIREKMKKAKVYTVYRLGPELRLCRIGLLFSDLDYIILNEPEQSFFLPVSMHCLGQSSEMLFQ